MNSKATVVAIGAVALGCLIFAVRQLQSGSNAGGGIEPERNQASAPGSSADPSEAPQLPHPTEAEGREAPISSAATPSTGEEILKQAEACLRPDLGIVKEAERRAIWACLQPLDWSGVTAPELAGWICATTPHLTQSALVIGAALHAREPDIALSYLSQFDPPCLQVRESGLQIMAVEIISLGDPAWVEELGDSMAGETLFTGQSSEQGLLLAEFFIRRGNDRIATVLEKGGRGEYGGSNGEIDRAAAVSLFVTSTMQRDPDRAAKAWSYAESLLHSPTTTPATGNILATFLPNKQTWPDGDSVPALSTLSLALDDPELRFPAAAILWKRQTVEGPPGCDEVLWKEIYAKVQVVAAESGWAPKEN